MAERIEPVGAPVAYETPDGAEITDAFRLTGCPTHAIWVV